MNALVDIKQLTVNLQQKTILSELTLRLQPGEILGLVGASGCGKSTLLNTIAGFIEPLSGYISIEGSVVASPNIFLAAEKRHVGMIFQDYALFPHLTVRQNINFGLNHLSKVERNERIDNLLGLLKLSDFEGQYSHQLSGGQQQRVAIARTLATQPKLLLLDEPFSNIDARLRNELMLEIRQLLKQLNITAIFVTHNKDEVFTFADKMAVMSEGKILQLGSPTTLCQTPNSYQVADFLQLGSFIPCKIQDRVLRTIVGGLALNSSYVDKKDNKIYYLLVKPKHLRLSESSIANAQVIQLSSTEHGYHYLINSIENNTPFAFTNLSLHSDKLLIVGQYIAVEIIEHSPIFFDAING